MKRILALTAVCGALVLVALMPRKTTLAAPPEAGPLSLVNPDGQALNLEKYSLRVAVQGALSLVEMEMVFRNPENKQMEGRFSYTLPAGAVISRFAKEVNGKLMEGEIVERLRAQAIYTEILQTLRDPALLEMDQGNKFSARVFPVPANGTVRLLLSFSKLLPAKEGVRKLVIPLAGMPKIGEFDFSAVAKPLGAEKASAVILDKEENLSENENTVARHAQNFVPQRDIELTFKTPAESSVHALKAGQFRMVQYLYNPADARASGPADHDFVFYFDTSASGADSEAARLQVLDKLLLDLVPVLREKDSQFTAHAFDVEAADLLMEASMNSKGGQPVMPEVIHKLRARHSLGATDLGLALKKLGDEARASQKGRTFVLVSDGIATWGAREPKDLLAALGDWPAKDTLHALVIGTKQDERILNALVEKTRGRVITLPLGGDVGGNVQHAIHELRAPLGANFEAYDEGTAWIYPKTFHDVRPGEELVAFSEVKEGVNSAPGFVQRGSDGKAIKDTPIVATPVSVEEFSPLLRREAYRAFLDSLDRQEQAATDLAKRAELRKLRIETSVKNRVLCPLTSLLVLESEQDYQRFGIERQALPEIMEIAEGGIHMRKRSPDDVPPPAILPVLKAKSSPVTRAWAAKPAAAAEARGGEADRNKSLFAEDGGTQREGQLQDLADAAHPAPEGVELNALIVAQNAAGVDAGLRQNAAQAVDRLHEAQPFSLAVAPVSTPPASPAPRTPVALPQDLPRQEERLAREEVGRSIALSAPATSLSTVVAGKLPRPDWTADAGEIPSEASLSELRARVQAAPFDRRVRNNYADALFRAKKWDNLQAEVFQWLPFDPENPAVYEYLGKSATGLNDAPLALRAFSSIAEIAPNRAALLSRAGFLLLTAQKYDLAESMFREALKNRQDDCNIYRGLALTLSLAGKYENAAAEYETALMRDFNPRYGDTKRVLREEYGYLLRAWRKKEPGRADAIVTRAEKAGVDLFRVDALRVTLCWETDANDVDLHVVDPSNEECFYNHKNNVSGLELYSDQTQGLGPEVIRTAKLVPGTYYVGVNYFSAGPMGVSRGVVVIHRPVDGVDEAPAIVPFCLIEGGKDMRYVGRVEN